jgi:hypothetical protein
VVAADTEVVAVVVDSLSDVVLPQPAAKIVAITATTTASDRIYRLRCRCEEPVGLDREC